MARLSEQTGHNLERLGGALARRHELGLHPLRLGTRGRRHDPDPISLLGLRPAEGGIRIEPCLPADWPGYGATLRWGPGELRIRVENPDRLGHGPSSVEVDGEPWEEPVIPWPGPGRSRDVRVRISSDGSEPREAAHSTEAGDGENR